MGTGAGDGVGGGGVGAGAGFAVYSSATGFGSEAQGIEGGAKVRGALLAGGQSQSGWGFDRVGVKRSFQTEAMAGSLRQAGGHTVGGSSAVLVVVVSENFRAGVAAGASVGMFALARG